ncbi:non-ribosomal peptide synthetase [Motilimonas pumila]|uniref:Amino acid adenylation domain-containing protein n=1 Tax=Motilimonas pumila TaxID=2303987 RepID=A0A418YGB7_9GAMM|nr:non-ribosomal peptide synthetase [Motilimonas pumila]RJG48709.1 amino acid adenylation domain-containing protein [Motilimonas pumila]
MSQPSTSELALAKKRALLKKLLEQKQQQKQQTEMALNIRKQPLTVNHCGQLGYPMSFAQQRLWLASELGQDHGQFNMPLALQLQGDVNKNALQASLTAMLARHQVLRTVFRKDNEGRGQAVVTAPIECHLAEIDLTAQSHQEQQHNTIQLARQEAAKRFDLARDAMLRAQLIIQSKQSVLLLTLHHIAADAWSLSVLVNELSQHYQAACNDKLSLKALPEHEIEYADYALWQRDFNQTEAAQQHLNYWQTQLADLPPCHNLPLDFARKENHDGTGCTHQTLLPKSLVRLLEQVCQKQGATLFMALNALFSCLLARLSGQQDIVIGTPIANRERSQLAPLVGFFINNLVLRNQVDLTLNLEQSLAQSKQTLLAAYNHQQTPYDVLLETLDFPRENNINPLFQVMLSLQNAQQSEWQLGDIHASPLAIDCAFSKFDLTLNLTPTDAGLMCQWEYNSGLFNANTIERWSQIFEQLVRAAVAAPQAPLSQHHILLPQDAFNLDQWNQTQAPVIAVNNVVRLFERWSQQAPAACALVHHDNTLATVELSYGELNRQANVVAFYLSQQGVGQGDLVAISLQRGPNLLIAILATLKLGAAYLPVDPHYPQERVQYILSHSQAKLMLTTKSAMPTPPTATTTVIDWHELISHLAHLPDNAGCNFTANTVATDCAYVIYTSGSTGKPKGVKLAHNGLINLASAQQQALQVTPQSRVLQFASIAFDAATWEWVMALSHGASLHMCDESVVKSAELLSSLVAEQQITHATLPPVLLPHLPIEQWHSVQHLVVAGEAVSRAQAEKWAHQRCFYNAYGPSESTVCTTIGTFQPDQSELHIGKPIANLSTFVLDPFMQPVPIGVTGELYISGVGLADGYLHQPELTAERFIACATVSDSTLYKTGDLVYQTPAGDLVFAGRIDHQVKIRGFRVELGEIETQLLAMPGVKEVAVLAQGEPKRLLAYLVGQQSSIHDDLDVNFIKHQLSQYLPAYMVPSAMVQLKRLPLTPNGKLDRKALPDIEGCTQAIIEPAATDKEHSLCLLWQRLLKRDPISVTDSFFELGGDSILAIQLVAQAAKMGLHFTTQTVFETQTIRGLAEAASTQQQVQISQHDSEGEQPLLPIQQYFFNQSAVQVNHYNQSFLLRCPATLDQAKLVAIMTALYQKHDALRLQFQPQQGQWYGQYQSVDTGHIQSQVTQINLPDAAAIQEYASLCQTQLTLSKGDLVRASVIRDNAQNSYLLLVIHHLVIDGVSWRILFQDIATAWQQLQQNDTITLGPKTSSLQEWSQHLQQGLPELKQQIPFWQKQQVPLPQPFSELAPACVGETKQAQTQLSASLTESLIEKSNHTFNTQTPDLLLSALLLAMHRWQGLTSLPLALESHGREHQNPKLDISETLGWFTSLYPLNIQASQQSFRQLASLIKTVKEQLRQVPQQGQGYLLLQQAGELATTQQPALVFNYLGQFDSSFDQTSAFIPQQLDLGPQEGDQRPRPFAMGLNSLVAHGQLSIRLDYADSHFSTAEVDQLLGHFQQSLQDIIHCCLQTHTESLTPSDVPLSQLTQDKLDALSQQHPNMQDVYPATGMQQGMLFHSAVDASAYVSQIYLDLTGQFDCAVFADAWREVFAEQAIFRTQFVADNQLQMVLSDVALPWSEVDFSNLNASEQTQAFEQYRQQDKARGFRPDEAPLMRLTVAKLAHHSYRLLWTNHHALLDGWSMPLVFGAVMQGYKAKLQSSAFSSQLAPYKGYITWLAQQDYAKARHFWNQELEQWRHNSHFPSCPKSSDLATINQQHVVETQFTDLAKLSQYAQQSNVTVNTVLQGAWALLLQQHSQVDTLVFAETVAGRPPELEHVEQMVGLFINSLPVVLNYQEDWCLTDWLQQHHQQAQQRHQHSFLPLKDILKTNVHGPELSLQSLLIYENYPLSDAFVELNSQGQAFELSNINADEQTNFDLTLTINPGQDLKLKLNFSSSLFSYSKGQQLLSQLTHVLTQIISEPTQTLGDISVISMEEHQKLQNWNKTQQSWPSTNWLSAFSKQVSIRPHDNAVIGEQENIRYDELNRRSDALASYFNHHGFGKGQRIAVALERSPDMLIALIAIMKAGAAYVPLDPAYPIERLKYMVQDSESDLILTHSHLNLNFGQAQQLTLAIDKLDLTRFQGHSFKAQVSAQDSAYIIYTSGSTGKPKGVVISHKGLCNFLFAMSQKPGISAQDSLLAVTSISFDIHTLELFLPLIVGAKIVIAGRSDSLHPERLIKMITEHGITMMQATPATWKMLLDANWQINRPFKAMCGGEPMPDSLKQALLAQHSLALWNMYGPTETTVWSSVSRLNLNSPTSVGGPIANTSFYILDSKMKKLPIGVLGELYIGGHGLATEYYNRAELTQNKYVLNPFTDGLSEKLYATGDLASWNERGELILQGRIDQQIKIRGFRIELGEIESQLCRHSGVKEAIVVAVGEPNKLVCYYLPQHHNQPNLAATALSQYLANSLPRHMIPSAFQALEAMPLTANGKIDRKALIERPIQIAKTAVFSSPRGEVETKLSQIWAEILEIENNAVSRDDEFFLLGGDSLALIKLMHQVREVFNCELEASTFLNVQRLSQQAQTIETQPQVQIAQQQYQITHSSKDILHAPSLIKFHWHDIDMGQHLSMVQALIPSDLPFDLGHMSAALKLLWQRHCALSAKVELQQGKLMLHLPSFLQPEFQTRPIKGALEHYSYEALINESRADKVFATGQKLHQFSQSPTLTEVLLDENNQFALLITQEHAFADGLSTVILNRDFNAIYQSLYQQQTISLTPLAFNYADYQTWLIEQYPGTQEYQKARDFWQDYAHKYHPARLPHDKAAAENTASERHSIYLGLGASRSVNIRQLASQHSITLNHLLFSALAHMVSKILRQSNPSIGMILSGRHVAGTEHLVGAFADLVLLATNTEQNLLDTAKDVAIDSLNISKHQSLDYREFVPSGVSSGELIQGESAINRATSFAFAVDTHAKIPPEWHDAVTSQQWRYARAQGKQLSRWNWFRIIEHGEHLVLAVEYEGSHYQESTIQDVINTYLDVLDTFSNLLD